MKTKFTKGKWFAELGSKDRFSKVKIGHRILDLKSLDFDSPEYEEEQANALLISKAPEMFEMLVKLQGFLTAHTPEKIHDELEQLLKEATEL